MFIVVILFIVLVELFVVPVTETNLIILLTILIILMLLLEILFPRSPRFRKFSQKKLQELFAIRSIRIGFGHNPEKLESEKLTFFSQQPDFDKGYVIRLPFSYESNLSTYIDLSRTADLPHGRAMLAGVSDPVIRVELVCQEKRPVSLRGPEHIEEEKGIITDRFFLDRSLASCNKCKIQGYAIVLGAKSDYAVYRFPPLTLEIAKRRISFQEESS